MEAGKQVQVTSNRMWELEKFVQAPDDRKDLALPDETASPRCCARDKLLRHGKPVQGDACTTTIAEGRVQSRIGVCPGCSPRNLVGPSRERLGVKSKTL